MTYFPTQESKIDDLFRNRIFRTYFMRLGPSAIYQMSR